MSDGLGMAETTPGPLIMVLQFVGFMRLIVIPVRCRRRWRGCSVDWLPRGSPSLHVSSRISLGAPFIEVIRGNKALASALSTIIAAVVGVFSILPSGLAIHTIFRQTIPVDRSLVDFDAPKMASVDPSALGLSAAAAIAILRFKIGMIPTFGACCTVGVGLHLAGVLR